MLICPNCGKEVSEDMKFCPKCGNRLAKTQGEQTATFALYKEVSGGEQRKYINWFERHLNWTWIIVMLLGFTTIPFNSPIPYIIWTVLYFMVSFWVLGKKGRSWAWIFIGISIPFLANKKEKEV